MADTVPTQNSNIPTQPRASAGGGAIDVLPFLTGLGLAATFAVSVINTFRLNLEVQDDLRKFMFENPAHNIAQPVRVNKGGAEYVGYIREGVLRDQFQKGKIVGKCGHLTVDLISGRGNLPYVGQFFGAESISASYPNTGFCDTSTTPNP